jgi:soluble lytic murein transglycosylase-like protein
MRELPPLLGPDGVQQRMSEIQHKLDSVFGPSFKSFLPTPVGNEPMPGNLSGEIGGTTPFNPMSPGASLAPKASPEIQKMIKDAAGQAGVDEDLFDSLIAIESGYDPSARSRAGALGLAQLMPGTAQTLGLTNPMDPKQNLEGGAKYLAQLIRQFHSAPLALAAYNAGPGAVAKAGNAIPPFPETQKYVERVMGLFNSKTQQ